MSTIRPAVLVIVGITGDLSTRKLLPAINQLFASGAVAPDALRIVGITRRPVTTADVLAGMPADVPHEHLASAITMHQMDLDNPAHYARLSQHLDGLGDMQRLFYLSVPPQISQPIVGHLGQSGLAGNGAKILLEKPFGIDLASAEELIEVTKRYFGEDQIYRIDHYLAKDIAGRLIAARRHEGGDWDKRTVTGIDIVATERIAIEGRVAFYEQTGALRDFVQSHLLQLTALTLMQPPASDDMHHLPQLRRAALQGLHIPADKPVTDSVVRGQYEGYKQAVNNPHSTVETYVQLGLISDDPRWQGVPICLTTGKALARKCTEVRIVHTHGEDTVFSDDGTQGDDPYGRVFLDALASKRALFTSSDEVLESWRILQPIQHAWSMASDDLVYYVPGNDPKC
ncbi:MAG TPA: hypothetical protein VLF43_03150 [Candidatus Saccharimonadales bacterium]|nr:hypothetical protein [Candidatus Saccharimonadales bacterium]